MRTTTRQITEGAMMCALLGMMLILNRYLGNSLEIMFILVLPIPIVLYTVRHGLNASVMVYLSCIFISVMMGQLTTTFYIIFTLLIGIVYGEGVRRNQNSLIILLWTFILTFLLEVLTGCFLASFFGFDIEMQMIEINRFVQAVIPSAPDNLVTTVFLTSFVILAAEEVLIIHILSIVLLKRLKIKQRPFKTMFEISLGKPLTMMLSFFSLLLVFTGLSNNDSIISMVILVLGICSSIVLFVFGFIACLWLAHVYLKKNITILLAILCVVCIPIIMPSLVFLGALYNLTDFKDNVEEVMNGKK
ncbi:MAG: DUF2232 domain-containing protein [Erysipelotrichaceae bacterium]